MEIKEDKEKKLFNVNKVVEEEGGGGVCNNS